MEPCCAAAALQEQQASYSASSATHDGGGGGGGTNKFSFEHAIIALMIGVFTFAVVFFARIIRYRTRQRRVARIPRDVMPLLRPGDLPAVQRAAVVSELARSVASAAAVVPRLPALGQPPPPGLYGWELPEEGKAAVHYKTTVAKSFRAVEALVSKVDAGARVPQRDKSYAAREYVLGPLLEALPGVERPVAESYVALYESARFGPGELSEAEFAGFKEVFSLFLRSLESAARKASAAQQQQQQQQQQQPL
eukprot:m51a1_g941 hypothetical protein (251) ;mRNA; r:256508-257433